MGAPSPVMLGEADRRPAWRRTGHQHQFEQGGDLGEQGSDTRLNLFCGDLSGRRIPSSFLSLVLQRIRRFGLSIRKKRKKRESERRKNTVEKAIHDGARL